MSKKLIAVTACASGIAHTYMAAESIEKAAKEMGYEAKVETNGAIGAENVLTEKDISSADLVIVAADIKIDPIRFTGKRLYVTDSNAAINDGKALIEKAEKEATVFGKKGSKVGKIQIGNNKEKTTFFTHVMSGISYMIPMVIAAGLILTIANLYAFQRDDMGRIVKWGFDTHTQMGMLMSNLFQVGQVGFKLMIPLFAGFVANSIADKPAIAPAMIGAYIANDADLLHAKAGGGFISALLVAFIVGYFVKLLKKVKWPKIIQPIVPIMIIPFISTLFISLVVFYVIGQPIAAMMDGLYSWLNWINENSTSAPIVLGAVIGAMMGFDLGGPVNKTALIFGTAVFTDTMAKFGPTHANFVPQTASQAAISVAPLGVWLATIIWKKKFSKDEKTAASAALGMGLVGVTEGAIPFVAADPIRMIIANVTGSAVAGGLVAATGCKFYGGIGSPLGTFIGYIEQPIPFITWILCVSAGIAVTALIIGLTRSDAVLEAAEQFDSSETE
ncbi:fructose-specific PTS transporter subunit EIIC [Companilactobacillus allii]|uniref:PTS fructose transporter subunit IIB n=1 Tax=Companilactobacillus allii TaxID=1847728 RepID=A0A1P8Q0R6_9LACO|nr:fructose-specific PTS transporter subunit EIIC [Companilactobacillus allii]APX71415.1 PTS fructose transporter subunit IIB [Companilactobacillus allii]USQ68495.1 fructose-specific PTS transporter subunit EIIC [Companilactobacillus allii]